MALLADGVSALLIDGKLTSGSGGTFATINPATEEVLGAAADADAEDMGRAIEAARRAFDETDWSRNTELRVRCVRQLREAMQQHLEELRDLTIAEVGAPRMLTAIAQLEVPGQRSGFRGRYGRIVRIQPGSRRGVADGHPYPAHDRP